MAVVIRAILVVTLLVVAGCALSPQAVNLQPRVLPQQVQAVGRGQTFSVQVLDQRPYPEAGSRGGIYRDSSKIKLISGLQQPLAQALTQGWSAWGFVPAADPEQADVKIQVRWDQLDYAAKSSFFPNKVTKAAGFEVSVEYAGMIYSNRYSRSGFKRFGMIPNEQQNQQEISELVSETASQLFADGKLVEFLQR